MTQRPSAIRQSAIAATLLLAQVVGVLHLVLVDHRRCPEHGEMVEVTTPPSPTAKQESSQPGLSADHGEQAHDHCLFIACFRTSIGLDAPGMQAWLVPDAPAVHASTGADNLGPGFARYLVAPKTSPPV